MPSSPSPLPLPNTSALHSNEKFCSIPQRNPVSKTPRTARFAKQTCWDPKERKQALSSSCQAVSSKSFVKELDLALLQVAGPKNPPRTPSPIPRSVSIHCHCDCNISHMLPRKVGSFAFWAGVVLQCLRLQRRERERVVKARRLPPVQTSKGRCRAGGGVYSWL